MKKEHRVWLKTAGIVSFCFVGIVVFVCVCLLFDFFGARDVFEDTIRDMLQKNASKSSVDFMRFATISEMLFGCVINIYAGVLQISLSKKEYIVVGLTRLLINLAICQFLFTVNIFSAIIDLVLGMKLNKSVWQNKGKNTIDSIAHEVEKLRLLRDKGVVTAEQWNAEFNRLLEEYSQQQNDDKSK